MGARIGEGQSLQRSGKGILSLTNTWKVPLVVAQEGLLSESYLICKELEPHEDTFTSLAEKETMGLFLELNSPPVDEVK